MNSVDTTAVPTPKRRRRFATAFAPDDPMRIIGIETYADIHGVSVSMVRRWLNPKGKYHDRTVERQKPGNAYQWFYYQAIAHRDAWMLRKGG